MAYDPEAREQSNSAMVIAVVALVVVVLGALAWFATRPADVPVAVTPTVERHTETETVREVPVPNDAPDTVIVQPNTPAPAPAPSTSTETQVTITPPANPPAASPAPAPAGDGAAAPADSGSGSSGY
jgi:cytoskeletal protein RodZ